MADINQIINYIMKTPTNSNWNVLSTLLGDGDWSKLKAYVETTPKNMNRQVLKALLGGSGIITKTITLPLSFNYDPEGAEPIYVIEMAQTTVDTDIWNFLEFNSSYNITATFASGLTSTIVATIQGNQGPKPIMITDIFEGSNYSVGLIFINQNDTIVASGGGSISAGSILPSEIDNIYGNSVTFTFAKVEENSAVVGTAVVGTDVVG